MVSNLRIIWTQDPEQLRQLAIQLDSHYRALLEPEGEAHYVAVHADVRLLVVLLRSTVCFDIIGHWLPCMSDIYQHL